MNVDLFFFKLLLFLILAYICFKIQTIATWRFIFKYEIALNLGWRSSGFFPCQLITGFDATTQSLLPSQSSLHTLCWHLVQRVRRQVKEWSKSEVLI